MWALSQRNLCLADTAEGRLIPAVGGRNTSYLNWGNIVILDFKPQTHTIDVWWWRTSTNVADTSFVAGGKVTYAWNPQRVRVERQHPGGPAPGRRKVSR
jgi:hypothetical protein